MRTSNPKQYYGVAALLTSFIVVVANEAYIIFNVVMSL